VEGILDGIVNLMEYLKLGTKGLGTKWEDFMLFKNRFLVTTTMQKVSFLCCHPSIGFKRFLERGPKSVIFVSATLQPFSWVRNNYAHEFKVTFSGKQEEHDIFVAQIKSESCLYVKDIKKQLGW
jgi:hypothetical protein